ncbi:MULTISPECIES: hypothetical protein [Nostocales]|uniref:Uncharacterized protein n=3 Tax=Nostocales TaxID=1161 RepID=A0A8S9T457_9CYAN|nr:hypothetical protein [Tolypothrix bouteillei]KAF3886848.1 hypothetical protein DA73_0400016165 [Tolypothrix bouteillei VB521301]
MESVNEDNTELIFLKDLQLGLCNNEPENVQDLTVLFEIMDVIENTIEVLEKIFTGVNQFNSTVAQSQKTKQKDSQFIESTEPKSGETLEIEDRIELLSEQVETLKQLLYYREVELQEIRHELHNTNMDLCAAINSPWLSLDEAKELAKQLLVSKKSSHEILAELLGTICNLALEPLDLEDREISNFIKASINKPVNCSLTINYQGSLTDMIAVRKKAAETRAKSKMLREQSRKIQAQSRQLKAQFIEQGIKFVSSQASFTARQRNFRRRRKLKKNYRAD